MSSCRGRPRLIHPDPSLFFPTVLLPTQLQEAGSATASRTPGRNSVSRLPQGCGGPMPAPLLTADHSPWSPVAPKIGRSRPGWVTITRGGLSKRRVPG